MSSCLFTFKYLYIKQINNLIIIKKSIKKIQVMIKYENINLILGFLTNYFIILY
jgi:hypothetical protein